MFENWFNTKDYNDYYTAGAILRWWSGLSDADKITAVLFADRERLSIYIMAVDIAVLMNDPNFDSEAALELSKYYLAVEGN